METRLDRVLAGAAENKRLQQKVEELQALAEKTTASLSEMPKGKGGKGKDELWNQLIDLKEKYELQLKIAELEKLDLETELDCIRNSDIRTAMKLFYVDGAQITTIAATMVYSPRTIDRYLQKGREIYERYYGL